MDRERQRGYNQAGLISKPPGRPPLNRAEGAALFRSSCTRCHSIAGVGPRSPSGGELDHYHLTQAQLAGLTRVMPTVRHLSE